MWDLRCGSIREILSCFPLEISKTEKQMSSSNIPQMRLVIVCVIICYYEICKPSPDLHTIQWKPMANFPKMLKSMRRIISAKRTEIAYSISVTRETLILTISECPKIYECTNIFNSFWFFVVLLYLYWSSFGRRGVDLFTKISEDLATQTWLPILKQMRSANFSRSWQMLDMLLRPWLHSCVSACFSMKPHNTSFMVSKIYLFFLL